MWTLILSIGSKFWKQISVGLFAVIATLRYMSLKNQNRRLKTYVKKRIVIDHIESEHQAIEEEEKKAKEMLKKAKTISDFNKEWNK